MPPNLDLGLLLVQLQDLRTAPPPQAQRWRAAHRFGRVEPSERRLLPGWRDSFAERQTRLRSPESFLSLRELPERPTKPVQFRVPRVILKDFLKKDRAILGPM